jgi:hypothetical protein
MTELLADVPAWLAAEIEQTIDRQHPGDQALWD